MPRAQQICHLLLLSIWSSLANAVVINEVMAVNQSTVADEDSDYPDWIELYNSSGKSVNLSGYGLSDDVSDPFKWMIAELTLAPSDFLLIFASDKDRSDVVYWNTIIQHGDDWAYWPGTREPPSDWAQPVFDDSEWAVGASGFGYGDADDATVIANLMSIYVRKRFVLDNPHDIIQLLLHVDYDDAFIAYLNGFEVARANIGRPGESTPYDRAADSNHEALLIQGYSPERFVINDLSHVRRGENILALQVHNVSSGSSDMTLIPFLTLGSSMPQEPATVPDVLHIPKSHLHTNFKIKGDGEILQIVDVAGNVVDTVRTPALAPDVSFGRLPDGQDSWRILALPTPGGTNIDSGFTMPAAAPIFSLQGGLYNSSLSVELSDTSGGDIYYTLDGSDPDENDNSYTTPIFLKNNTCLRARTFHSNRPPSRIVTNTFIFNEDTEFAIVALASDPYNLYDDEYGIFAFGPNASSEYPYFGANFWQDWERPVHVEFFEPNGTLGFKLDAGMKVFGGWSRGRDQKALAIFQRGIYDTRQINYQIFPDKPITSFESFLLRNGGNAWDGTIFRDAYMQALCEDFMDLETMAYRPAQVYLNGDYWGILIVREKINEHFVAANRGLDPDRLDILDGSGRSSSQVMAGSNHDYLDFWHFIETHDLALFENYAQVDSMMDISNFIDYQIAEIYIANTDWPGNNIKYYKPQTPGGTWRWLIYDTDFGFHLYDTAPQHNTLAFATEPFGPDWPNPPWSTLLLRSLLQNQDFTRQFINRFADHLNTTFDVDRVVALLDEFDALFYPEMFRQRERWPGSANQYNSRLQRMYNFANRRELYVRSHIRQMFNIAGDIKLNLSTTGVGRIKVNSKIISRFPWQGTFFQDVPVTLTAIPAPGYRFTRWNGLNDEALTTIYDSRKNLNVTALFESADGAVEHVVINEINYNSGRDFPAKDWLELYNPTNASTALAGWQINDGVGQDVFTLPSYAYIPAFGYAVLCRDSTHLNFVYSDIDYVFGDFPFNLNNAGDSLYLYNATGQLVDSLVYNDELPWPVEADGTGYTLELRSPELDNAHPANWAASSAIGGTPGRRNSIVSRIANPVKEIPTDYFLAQNYPNPFNASTTIEYVLQDAGFVQLVIYDLVGREVETVLQKNQGAGRHTITWQTNMPSGVYFYRLYVRQKEKRISLIKKMVLLR
ncbi:T9SS C-terminal target domain-containing protein [candidate division KSB1 bacterium]|nr:CotH kinase family protein [candidate division KSB1 bacterium]RQW01308.1 MAG: T9SS C-terminal target domain-containing protein [candidate division KSB1 bacterium]